MPYVPQDKRPGLDNIVDVMVRTRCIGINELANLLVQSCKMVKPSYNVLKNWCGEIDQCATEILRRIAGLSHYQDCLREYDVDHWFHDDPVMEGYAHLAPNIAALKIDGDLNYVLFKYARHNADYWNLIVSAMVRAVKRIKTEILAPYEDEKIKENGDVL